MREYGLVYSRFWTSRDIRALSDDARLLAIYLLSGPHGTIAGVCRLPDGYVCEDLGWNSRRVSKGFAELFKKGFANRCETTKWVMVSRFLAWNTPQNPNQWKAVDKIVATIPSNCSWKAGFLSVLSEAKNGKLDPLSNPSTTVSKPFRNQDQDFAHDVPRETDSEAERREHLLALKAAYPSAPREDWRAAEQAIGNAIRDGTTWQELHAGVARYAKHCRATKRFVQNPALWFSAPDRPWLQEWAVPDKRKAAPSDEAAWAEAKTLAREIGFRDPHPHESAAAFATQVKLAKDRAPESTVAGVADLAAKLRGVA